MLTLYQMTPSKSVKNLQFLLIPLLRLNSEVCISMQLSAHGFESLHISLTTHLSQFTSHIDLMRFSRK